MAARSNYSWQHQLLDLGLMLLSISLWAVAAWMAFNGALVANFGEGDWRLLFGALVPAAAGWFAWPSARIQTNKKSPWSY